MKIKYFPDTDMALIEFSSYAVSETKEISEDCGSLRLVDQSWRIFSKTQAA